MTEHSCRFIFRRVWFTAGLLLLVILPGFQLSYAQSVPPIESHMIVSREDTGLSVSPLVRLWSELLGDLDRQELGRASDTIALLISAREASGVTDLPEYAMQLIDRGEGLLEMGDQQQSRQLYRWAYRLAPHAPEVLWRILPVASRFGIESSPYLVSRAISATLDSPVRALIGIEHSIMPLLKAVSWALFLAMIAVLSASLIDIFRVMAWRVPTSCRGWAIPLLFFGIFSVPLFLGMLWCLTFWSIAFYLLVPERRFFSLLAGIVILAWGALVPVAENISTWLEEPKVRRVVLGGDQPLADQEFGRLLHDMSEWSTDTVVQFKFAQLLRRAGHSVEALRVLDRLENQAGEAGWISAERAVLAYIGGDVVKAEQLLRDALVKDGESAEVLFNLSRVVFDLNRTRESRELSGQALRRGKVRVESYQQREELLGGNDPRSFADAELPLGVYFSAALIPNTASFNQAHGIIARHMPGMEPRLVSMTGLLLILMHLLPHRRSRRINPRGLFEGYRPGLISRSLINLVPGGFLIVSGQMRRGFLLLCAVVFCSMPLANGAYEKGAPLATLDWFMPYHICTLMLVYLVLMLCALGRKEG